jgi:hypothetical protein
MSTADTPPEVRRTLAQEFFDFLKTFGIIGLAIAFVIGQAASRLVTALVNDNYWVFSSSWKSRSSKF